MIVKRLQTDHRGIAKREQRDCKEPIDEQETGFLPWIQKLVPLLQHIKQQHRKALLSSFYLYDHTLGCYPQTQTVTTPLKGTINNITGKYFLVTFIQIITLKDFIHRLKSHHHLVQHNKQHHRKVLLRRFQ